MKLTEDRLRRIIREELNEMGGGSQYAIYEIEPSHLKQFEDGFHPESYGIKMKEGDANVLHNWANRQGWSFRPERSFGQEGYYVDRQNGDKKFYVIAKNK